MNMALHQMIHGFKVISIQMIEELKATGYEMFHEKSGAKLYYLQAEDDNKVFAVSFRTPPNDSTGLPHILEHSVLCGSEKYPLKDPFVELAKGSLNTFLNAMTFSDKTMYPIASKNEQDFMNLMGVYMDAVFFPNLIHQPEILKQEGWHYHLTTPDDPIEIKGVVYNEMKGAFSSPEQVLFRKIQETLFPDTPYGFESGGDPDDIPDLTQEHFIDFHKTYYHPSNAYFYLYGNGDLEKHLAHINDDYLSRFDKIQLNSSIPLQTPFEKPQEITIPYPVGKEEEEEGKTYLSMNYVTGNTTDPEMQLAMEMLNYLLLGTSASPLKKVLLQAGIGKDVFGSFDGSILQPVFSIIVKNSDEDKKETFTGLVEATLRRLVDEGIDKKLVESVINIHEFKLREADYGRYPKGLIYGMKLMESWLYDKNPALQLGYEAPLKKIKEALHTPYFENLIQSMLLNNNHRNVLVVIPEKGLNEKKELSLIQALADKKTSMKEEEVLALMNENQHLQQWQDQPHTEEALSSIPLLTIDDLEAQPERIPTDIDTTSSFSILKHNIFTNQIQYTSMFFDTSAVPESDLPYLGLLVRMLGRLNTRSYTYEELSNELNLHTGGLHATTDVVTVIDEPESNKYLLKIKGKSLAAKSGTFWHLVDEIFTSTQWEDMDRIREVIREIKSRLEMSLHQEGHMVAARRILASFSTESAFNELTGGISFYHFMSELDQNFEQQIGVVISRMKNILNKVLVKENGIVSYTGEEAHYPEYVKPLKDFMDKLESNDDANNKVMEYKPLAQGNEGLILSSKVQYVAKASNFKKHGFNYSGSMQVLKTIVSLDYLWKKIRVTGGAYGAMAGFSRNGNGFFVSYRDPNLRETLQVYNGMAGYLETFQAGRREMTKYVIGTMSRMDMPLTPSMKGDRADHLYLSNYSWEDELMERNQVIHTTVDDIRGFSELVNKMMQDNIYCVVGNETKINEASSLFDSIIHVNR